MNFKLKSGGRRSAKTKGKLVSYEATDISPHTSFLEMLDIVNERLIGRRRRADRVRLRLSRGNLRDVLAHDQRRSARARSSGRGLPALHAPVSRMARRSRWSRFAREPFPFIKDLVVDRSALDRIVQAGGFIAARAGSAPEANSIPVPKHNADLAMEAAACIGCGACAAACPNASAMLFTSAKVSHLALLPQGEPERTEPRAEDGRGDGRGRFRQLHEYL